MATPSWLVEEREDVRISVRLIPRAARDEVAGERRGSLLVRVSAPPVDDRANEALVHLLAKRLRVGRGKVGLVSGRRARQKVVAVAGLSAEEVARRLS